LPVLFRASRRALRMFIQGSTPMTGVTKVPMPAVPAGSRCTANSHSDQARAVAAKMLWRRPATKGVLHRMAAQAQRRLSARAWARRASSAALKACSCVMALSVRFRQSRISRPKKG
jgi:hypothetical protein